MKKISVNENCSGCGLCIVNCCYLQENSEGNAEPIPGKVIRDEDIENVKKVIAECPENALQIVETGNTNKKGREGVEEIIAALRNQCNSFTVKKISNSDVRLNSGDYHIPIPSSSKEYKRDYTSKSSAKSAAKDEFNRLCYSESAFRPMLKKVFVEYKVNVLKPYYTCTDTEDSVYYSYNQQIRKILYDTYAEIDEVLTGSNKIPNSWRNFSVYLNDKDWQIESLRVFDERSTNSGIITDLRDRGEYTSLSWYLDRLDYDYDEIYIGEGLFGKSKYKTRWYFSGLYEEAKEFIEDLKGSIDAMSKDIEDEAVNIVNYALKDFEEKVKEKLSAKISELEKYVK